MWTGTKALKNIDQTLQTIRNEVVRLDAQLANMTDSMAAKQRQRLKIINDIAAVRLIEIERGSLQEDITAADQQAAQILTQRSAALQTLNESIEQHNQQLVESELQRDKLLEKVNLVSQQIVEGETQVQAQLSQDSAYLAQLEQARASESVALEATQKAESAEQDLAEKAKPYKRDKLFMYLWNRDYATTDYNGGLFSRFMDSWVARVIKYSDSRVNFWNLTEIPKRLGEHASHVSQNADEQRMALQQLELNALQTAGIKDLEDKLVSLRDGLDKHDDALEVLESKLNGQLEQRASFMAGEDEYIHRCIARISQALDHQSLQSIHNYVLATTSPTDDQLVLELQDVQRHLDDMRGDLTDVRLLHDNKLNKLKELELVRRNFKNSRFDDVRSGFGNESIISGVLGQFIQGVVSGSDLWRTIERNQRYRNVGSTPDFGSGGLGNIGDLLGGGRSRGGSSWHWPSPRRGGGGFNLPSGGSRGRSRGRSRSRSSGGGGFRTGGSF